MLNGIRLSMIIVALVVSSGAAIAQMRGLTERTAVDRSVISLPESVAERKPRQTLVVTITREAILVQGEAVVSVAAASGAAGEEIGVLRTALARQLERTRIVPVEADADAAVHEVMIMGDKSIPFALLRKVMLTCTRAGYEHISLSVIQRAPRPG